MDSDFRGAVDDQPMMKNFLNFSIWIRIYTLLYFLFMTIIHYDEKFFEIFSFVLYIHIVVFSMLKSIIKTFKTFCLVLYYVYIVFLYIVCFSLSFYTLYIAIHTLFFFLFYCRILSDINVLFLFLFLIAVTYYSI